MEFVRVLEPEIPGVDDAERDNTDGVETSDTGVE